MDRTRLQRWVARYERAWRTPGTSMLSDLFSDDATYRTAPFETPHEGLPAIAAMWEAERSSADEEFTLTSDVVAIEGDVGVVRVEVRYESPREQLYRDLWILRFDSAGRCVAFEEWPFWPPGTTGSAARGAS
jgi:hypothetical protein